MARVRLKSGSRVTAAIGRPRDDGIDRAVIAATLRHLGEHGYGGLSIAAIAAESGTTRTAIYLRWPSKADLVTAAVADLAFEVRVPETDDAFADLVALVDEFVRSNQRTRGMALIGALLVEERRQPELVALFRERLLRPRRARIRAVLERARDDGLIDADADLALAENLFTGAWYAHTLTGNPTPRDWAPRLVRLIWRALGGLPPRSAAAR
jgi:AcrR family transcriptional regulator